MLLLLTSVLILAAFGFLYLRRTRFLGGEEAVGRGRRRSSDVPLLLFCLAVIGSGFAIYDAARSSVTASVHDDLAAVARLKVGQIEHWFQERRIYSDLVSNNPLFAEQIELWLKDGRIDRAESRELLMYLERVAASAHCRDITLLSADDGAMLLTTGNQPHSAEVRAQALAATRQSEPILEDMHRAEGGAPDETDIGFFAAVRSSKTGRPIAVMHLTFEPSDLLFPLIQAWPGPSKTAETLLVRREGSDVVFLNRLRHRPDAPLNFRLPVSTPDLVGARLASGESGGLTGHDYRHEPVLAYGMGVAGTPWRLVAKIDAAEAYADLNATAALTAALTALVLALTGWWMGERSRHIAARHRIQLERERLATRLNYLSKHANDCILLADAAGRIVEANDHCQKDYGRSREEMLALDFAALSPPAQREDFAALRRRLAGGDGLIYEAEHCRGDGTVFPVEISACLIDIDGEEYTQAIIRDITERKRADSALRRYAHEVEDLYEHAPCGYHSIDAEGRICRINDTELEWLGYSRDEVAGRLKLTDLLTDAGRRVYDETFARLKESGEVRDIEQEMVRRDGTVMPVLMNARAIFDEQGRFVVSRTTVLDLTDRKKVEEERALQSRRIADLSRRLVAVQEEERRQLSTELHDRTSPNLAAMQLQLRNIAATPPAQLAESLGPALEDLNALLEDTSASVREVSADLRPPVLDHAGLVAALTSRARQFELRTGIAVEFESTLRQTLAAETETLLFRIVQEALTNVAKHARASAVHIALEDGAGGVVLRISDNGEGFDPGQLGQSNALHGLGLISMRERAEFAGGHFRIESRPGRGTDIEVAIEAVP